jgi:hypothetical protein
LPFPIETPAELADFLPLEIPILTTRVDTWSDRKIELLRETGYQVEVLLNRDPKGVDGSTIRSLIAAGDGTWTAMVPAATVDYLRSLELRSRMNSDVAGD